MEHPEKTTRVAVVGASGFVGGAVCFALKRHGAASLRVHAPRLRPVAARNLANALREGAGVTAELARRFHGADVVVNAAGVSQAGSDDIEGLLAANGLLPAVVAAAAHAAGVPRVIHISSGAVQGDMSMLDSSAHVQPFSPYSVSKAVGEQGALRHHPGVVVYRPAGVQGVLRPVSRNLVRLSRTGLAMVAGDGAGNSPQALIENVADAVAFLALSPTPPPQIVHHPSEGLSVGNLLELLGGRPPRRIPVGLARAVVGVLSAVGRVLPGVAARRRRFEVMWFGQDQAPSWLTSAGWRPVVGPEGWRDLGAVLSRNADAAGQR